MIIVILSVCLTPPHLSHVQAADDNSGACLHGHDCRHSVCLSVCLGLFLSDPSQSLMSRWLTTILVLVYMAMVVVILLNILIAQLSTTYEDARKIARLQYDVDRMRIITRLESSRLESFVCIFVRS